MTNCSSPDIYQMEKSKKKKGKKIRKGETAEDVVAQHILPEIETAKVEERKDELTEESSKKEKKLSKKEKKAKEFREKKKDKLSEHGEKEPNDDNADDESKEISKKRQREEEEDDEGNDEEHGEAGEPDRKKAKAERRRKRKVRFILFVGNLPHGSTRRDVAKHFEAAHPSAIRMRKGYAFLEFTGDEGASQLNVALRFHGTKMRGRKINVELTVGGGGNSVNRRKRLKEKNDQLAKERQLRITKEEQERLEREEKQAKKERKARKYDKNKVKKNPAAALNAINTGAGAANTAADDAALSVIHPSRLRLLK